MLWCYRYPMLVLVVLTALLLTSHAMAQAETVRETQRTVEVHYEDGFVERYVVVYLGELNHSWHEIGRPSSWTHPVDTRTCHWNTTVSIQRDVYLLTRQGARAIYEPFTTRFETSYAGRSAGFSLHQLQAVNCNQAAPARQSDLRAARAAITHEFDEIVRRDLETMPALFEDAVQVDVGETED